MMDSFVMRLASGDDFVGMHAVRMSVHENRLSRPDRITRSDYDACVKDGCAWVCEVNREIVAFGIADGASRSIWALFVAPPFEGRGMGRALLAAMTAWLFERDHAPIWLTTDAGTRAERFYQRAGWHDAGIAANGELRFELRPE